MSNPPRLEFHWFSSGILNAMCPVWICIPANYDVRKRYNLLLVLDGVNESIYQYVFNSLKISQDPSPVIFAFIDAPKTSFCPLFILYLRQEFFPWLLGQFSISECPKSCGVVGIAHQATSALYIGLKMHRKIGRVVVISPGSPCPQSQQSELSWLFCRFSELPILPIELFFHFSSLNFSLTVPFVNFFVEQNYKPSVKFANSDNGIEFWVNILLSSFQ